MPPIDSQDIPSGPGPNSSMPFGDATQTRQEMRTMQSAGSSPRNPMPAMPGGGPPQPQGAPPQQGQPQPPPGPVQPAPLTRADMQPGGPVFMQPQLAPAPSWREQLRVWAQHPEANLIRRLSERADAGMPKQGGEQQ